MAQRCLLGCSARACLSHMLPPLLLLSCCDPAGPPLSLRVLRACSGSQDAKRLKKAKAAAAAVAVANDDGGDSDFDFDDANAAEVRLVLRGVAVE